MSRALRARFIDGVMGPLEIPWVAGVTCIATLVHCMPEAATSSGKGPGPFILHERLGIGAHGTVYRAEYAGRPCAVKILHSAGDPQLRARFLREADLLSRLQHPRLVQPISSGVFTEGPFLGEPYLAMEYCPRGTLAGWGDQPPQTSSDALTAPVGASLHPPATAHQVAELLHLFDQAAEGLQALHEAGVVHRDVKPSNILLREDGACIADLGVAMDPDRRAELTRTNEKPGTPIYMAPEQVSEGMASPASDLYSLCATFYRVATGVPTIGEEHLSNPLPHIGRTPIRPAHEVREGLPTALSLILDRGLQPDPADRYPDLKALRADLQAARTGQALQPWRMSYQRRLSSWLCHHKKTLVRIAGVALVVVAMALAVVAWVQFQASNTAQERESDVRRLMAEVRGDRLLPYLIKSSYEERLRRVLALDPAREEAADLLAVYLLERDREQEARQVLLGFLASNAALPPQRAASVENTAPHRWLLALAHLRCHEPERAADVLKDLGPADGPPTTWQETLRRCLYLMGIGRADRALQILEAASPPVTDEPERIAQITLCHQALMDDSGAAEVLEAWIRVARDDWTARIHLAHALSRMRRYRAAAEVLAEIERLAGHNRFVLKSARIDMAIQSLESRASDGSSAAVTELANSLKLLEQETAPGSDEALEVQRLRRRLLLAVGDHEELERTLSVGPSLVLNHELQITTVAARIRRRMDQDHADNMARMGRSTANRPIMATTQPTPEELQQLEAVIGDYTSRPLRTARERSLVVTTWIRVGMFQRALEEATRWTIEQPEVGTAFSMLALAQVGVSAFEQAVESARIGVNLRPHSPQARETLANALYRRMQQLRQAGGQRSALHVELAMEGVRCMKPLAEGEGARVENHINHSYFLFHAGGTDGDLAVRAALLRGLKDFPTDAQLHDALADVNLREALRRERLDRSGDWRALLEQPELVFLRRPHVVVDAAVRCRDFDLLIWCLRLLEPALLQVPSDAPRNDPRRVILRNCQSLLALPHLPEELAAWIEALVR